MKIVHILGGLGNQMFQYAFAIALKEEFPDETIKIDVSTFNGYPLHNGFEIENIFESRLPHASMMDICRVAWPLPHYRAWQIGIRILPQRRTMISDRSFPESFDFDDVRDKQYFLGYWGQSRFFEKHKIAVLKALQFPEFNDENNLNALAFIDSGRTAFIHVRRGDYLSHPSLGGVCTLNYYNRAIHSLMSKYEYRRFIVFSNDISWCREMFKKQMAGTEVLYADWNRGSDSYRDMQLMSHCRGGVIANSSFSYWGGYLADAEVILRPDKWTRKEGYMKDILPDKWHRIEID